MKITTILEITWDGVTEVIGIDDKMQKNSVIYTTETWPHDWGGLEIEYKAKIQKRVVGAENNEVQINYRRDNQANPKFFTKAMKVRWGTWKITWRNSKMSGEAIWIDREASYNNGNQKGKVKILQWQRAVSRDRKRTSKATLERPDQRKLRNFLLKHDKCCAISKQEDREALDVAHIIPAKNLNYDVTDNAILLRADLHRLFDAGTISLTSTPNGAKFEWSENLSQNYKRILETAQLPQKIFDRIAPAIAVREKMQIRKGSGRR